MTKFLVIKRCKGEVITVHLEGLVQVASHLNAMARFTPEFDLIAVIPV